MTREFDYTEFADWPEYHDLGEAIRALANRLDARDREGDEHVPEDAREVFTDMVTDMASATHFGHVCRCSQALEYAHRYGRWMTPIRVQPKPETDSARVLFVCRFCHEAQSFGFSEVSPV